MSCCQVKVASERYDISKQFLPLCKLRVKVATYEVAFHRYGDRHDCIFAILQEVFKGAPCSSLLFRRCRPLVCLR